MNEASNYMLGKCGSENRSDVVMLNISQAGIFLFSVIIFDSYHNSFGFFIRNQHTVAIITVAIKMEKRVK